MGEAALVSRGMREETKHLCALNWVHDSCATQTHQNTVSDPCVCLPAAVSREKYPEGQK